MVSPLTLLALAGLLLAAPIARAQMSPVLDMSVMTGKAAAQSPEPSARNAGRPGKYAGKSPAASGVVLTYAPTPALREQTVQAEANRLQASSPTEATSLRMSFAPGKNDYSRLYASMVAGSGFADNDAASSLALYLEVAYRVVHNILDDQVITPGQERGLRAQTATVLSQKAALRDPAAVARLGETLKLRSVMLALDWQRVRQSSGEVGFRSAVVRQFKAEYRLDFNQLKITAQGFAKK